MTASLSQIISAPKSYSGGTPLVWKEFCRLLGASASLSSGFPPQSNGQTERKNQGMEVALRCIASHSPLSWAKQLLWVEYAHNTLPTSASGLFPFQCSLCYQPPLFPEQEREASVPGNVLAFIRCCHCAWLRVHSSPDFWEVSKSPLGTYPRPQLPRQLRIHPTFHSSNLWRSPLQPAPTTRPLHWWGVGGRTLLSAYSNQGVVGGDSSTWWTGRVTVPSSSLRSIGPTQISPVGSQLAASWTLSSGGSRIWPWG